MKIVSHQIFSKKMLLLCGVLLCHPAIVHAQESLGDLRVCRVGSLQQFTTPLDGSELGLAAATVGWNAGNVPLMWKKQPNPNHPFISQSIYRLQDGVLKQIGISGVKHGFAVAAATGCDGQQCTGPSGSVLHPNCNDAYSADLNANQNHLGPRYEVNPWTGKWDSNEAHITDGHSHNSHEHLTRVESIELEDNAATYMVESYYVHPQSANPLMAAAWSKFDPILGQDEVWKFRMEAAPASKTGFVLETAWPGAEIMRIAIDLPAIRRVSPDGRSILAVNVTEVNGDRWKYDYAILNVDMDRQISSFQLDFPNAESVEDIYFHAPTQKDEHFSSVAGQETDDEPWAASLTDSGLAWNTSTNPLRWGVMYNFGFISQQGPTLGKGLAGLFKPGAVGSIEFQVKVPGE